MNLLSSELGSYPTLKLHLLYNNKFQDMNSFKPGMIGAALHDTFTGSTMPLLAVIATHVWLSP